MKWDSDDEQSFQALVAHNEFRCIHGSSPLRWSESCAAAAQAYANHMLTSNTFTSQDVPKDQTGKPLGQNIACAITSRIKKTWGSLDATKLWYREHRRYDYSKPGFSPRTGHFTQLVWQATTDFGIAVARDDHRVIVVANYFPPGNVLHEFERNVHQPVSSSS